MILLAGGDSFTWGNELPDCDESRFSRLSWSALLAEQYSLDYNCVAEGGASNQTIARKVMESVDSSTKLVAVMWTFPVRHELLLRRDHSKNLNKNYVNVSPWHLDDKYLRNYASSLLDLASHEYHEQQSLLSIYALQNFLSNRDIPYVFSAATTQVYDMLDKDTILAKEIESSWYRKGEGFYDWSKSKGYELSSLGHPIAQAHRDWIDGKI